MIRAFTAVFLSASCLFALDKDVLKNNKSIMEEAKQIGKQASSNAFEFVEGFSSPDDFLPKEDKGKTFDSDQAKKDVQNNTAYENKTTSFLFENQSKKDEYISQNESFEPINYEESSGYPETCHESSNPIEFSVKRTLSFESEPIIEQITKQKCQGHEERTKVKLGKGKSKAKEKQEALERDPSIASFHVRYIESGSDHHDIVIAKWRHVDDCKSCNHFESVVENRETGSVNISNEKWIYSNPELESIINSDNVSFLSSTCLDNSSKNVNGTQITRCWVEKLNFLYAPPKVSGCDFLKSQFCRLQNSICLKDGPFGCDLWKREFLCTRKLNQVNKYEINFDKDLLDEKLWKIEYEPNKNIADVVTKLEIFKEMDKELDQSTAIDVKEFQFFSGKRLRCLVHFMKDYVYDCCKKMGGIGVDVKMAKCDQDEIALFDLKNRGQCHYIGKRDNHSLGIKVSEKHIYCCFSSKLARLFIEAAKDQLNIDWGTAEEPNCFGLTQLQIKQVDFNKIDLSEAFTAPSEDYTERLKTFQDKIESGLNIQRDKT